MIPFSLRQLMCILAAFGFVIVLLTIIAYSIISLAIANFEFSRVLIPALGSIAGGIIGGIVAVIIAAYNVKRNSENERKKQLRNTLSVLILLREEIRDNMCTLDTVIADLDKFTDLQKHLFDDVWKSSLMHLVVSESLVIRFNVFYRKIALLKTEVDVDHDSIESVKVTAAKVLEDVRNEYEKIRLEINDENIMKW